jgi:hypothetical protein
MAAGDARQPDRYGSSLFQLNGQKAIPAMSVAGFSGTCLFMRFARVREAAGGPAGSGGLDVARPAGRERHRYRLLGGSLRYGHLTLAVRLLPRHSRHFRPSGYYWA